MLCNFMNYQKYTISIIFITNYNFYLGMVRVQLVPCTELKLYYFDNIQDIQTAHFRGNFIKQFVKLNYF